MAATRFSKRREFMEHLFNSHDPTNICFYECMFDCPAKLRDRYALEQHWSRDHYYHAPFRYVLITSSFSQLHSDVLVLSR